MLLDAILLQGVTENAFCLNKTAKVLRQGSAYNNFYLIFLCGFLKLYYRSHSFISQPKSRSLEASISIDVCEQARLPLALPRASEKN